MKERSEVGQEGSAGSGTDLQYEVRCDSDGCYLMAIGNDGGKYLICEYDDQASAENALRRLTEKQARK